LIYQTLNVLTDNTTIIINSIQQREERTKLTSKYMPKEQAIIKKENNTKKNLYKRIEYDI